jgi:3-oxoacyl-[acyl-carrier protein] reductase
MDLMLEGKVAFITGGSRGIGAATARALCEEGCRVAIHDLRDDEAARNTLEACARRRGEAIFTAGDVAERDAVEQAVRHVLDRFGCIDIVVHSAGIVRKADSLDQNDEGWRRVLDVHLMGARNVCRAVVPGMMTRKYGKIVLLCSMAAHMEGGDYGVAMAAKLQYMRDLARTLAQYNITVNAVSPGKIMTGLQDPYFPTEESRIRYARDCIPLQRTGALYPVADDVAYPIVLLCSDRMSNITGVELHVNGGEYIQS